MYDVLIKNRMILDLFAGKEYDENINIQIYEKTTYKRISDAGGENRHQPAGGDS